MNLLMKQVELEILELNKKYRNMALSNQEKGLELLSREQKLSFMKEMTEKKFAKEVVSGEERKDIRYLTKQKKMEDYMEEILEETLKILIEENFVEESGYDKNIYIITEEYYKKVKNAYYN
jgi:hypothetical protein